MSTAMSPPEFTAAGPGYWNRESKAKYVWSKYQKYLKGFRILDVGCDEGYLRHYAMEGTSYFGIDKVGRPDIVLDLEGVTQLPFPDRSFDTVLCLDVLEHVDNLHLLFDDLCRVADRFVIVSLPNPYSDFYQMICFGDYAEGVPLKFYGLPLQPPEDRHKWFFSYDEAKRFLLLKSEENGFRTLHIDEHGLVTEGRGMRRIMRRLAKHILLRRDLNLKNLHVATIWSVLKRR